ncbi:MAG: hypothetical protein KatS3mg109_0113 [Pirellulaceae bacterium]|nr:MAG: hypothetical protein KatS3mg109_0113 [Pirellulaceae bacterium]
MENFERISKVVERIRKLSRCWRSRPCVRLTDRAGETQIEIAEEGKSFGSLIPHGREDFLLELFETLAENMEGDCRDYMLEEDDFWRFVHDVSWTRDSELKQWYGE